MMIDMHAKEISPVDTRPDPLTINCSLGTIADNSSTVMP